MNKLSIELINCYGIKELKHEFDFDKSNINVVYARNGLMKTSLTKTFKKIQDNKKDDVCDEIFGCTPVKTDIKMDGVEITGEDVFVIKSFEKFYESESVAALLIKRETKNTLEKVLKSRTVLMKAIEKHSGVKIKKTSLGKTVYELEPKIMNDFGFHERSILLNIEAINFSAVTYDYSNIEYLSIFDPSVLKKIRSSDFQNKIKEFLAKSDEIYSEYEFLDKGKFTLPKLKDIEKGLTKNSFFVKDNRIMLAGEIKIDNIAELKKKIKEIDSNLQATNEFKEIEKLLSDAKGMVLKDIIENNPSIIEELEVGKLNSFKKKIWLSYLKKEEGKFNELKDLYKTFEEEIKDTNFNETPWQEAIDIFNNRFTVPYCMEINNLKSAIIGESLPRVVFKFCKDGDRSNTDPSNWKTLDRSQLDEKDTLSQGERRALYLLNIIFDIERIRREGNKKLIVVDDIADSFDYKNKYAIIEYLKEIAENNNFNLLILSHNFDFYRTVSSRLGIPRNNRYSAFRNDCEIVMEIEVYQNQPFNVWKKDLSIKNTIALIPFVRNLIEYGVDKEVNSHASVKEDYVLLTNLLHLKDDSVSINYDTIKPIYKEYIGNDNFKGISGNTNIVESILTTANTVTRCDTKLENKIILSIATRLKAEKYMKKEIKKVAHTFTWKEGKKAKTGSGVDFLSMIDATGNQTRKLYEGFCQVGTSEMKKLLDSVNIMTPESIHLNSFMYEPILDMDIIELKNIYDRVSAL